MNNIICQVEPIITFSNELRIGKIKIPVKTEIDFSNVHESHHENLLQLIQKIYHKDVQI